MIAKEDSVKVYRTRNSSYVVNPVEKTVTRYHLGENSRWHDGRKIHYEFMSRYWAGGLYFHAIDPDTGQVRGFVTSEVTEVLSDL